jgi:HK97 family phage major capsid protein
VTAVRTVGKFDRGVEADVLRPGSKASESVRADGKPQVFDPRKATEILRSDQGQAALKRYQGGGGTSGPTGRFELGELATRDGAKALITYGQGGVNSLFRPDRRPLVDESAHYELTILDLVTIGSTDQNAVEYPAFTGYTGAAALIPDPVGPATTDAALKPDIALGFALRNARVRTIAAGIPVHRNILEDNQVYLESVIQEQLYLAIRQVLQAQILSGDGTGENFTGVLATSGIVSIAKGSTGHTAENGADAIHRAITALRLTGDQASAVVMHPSDYEGLRLMKDTVGNYPYGPPSLAGPLTIWGLPIVSTIAVPQGTAILADWSFVQLLIRKSITLLSSDSHSDFFMRNLIQFLAEMRAALLVTRPRAVAKVTGL